jgi:hypothetical protein
MLSSGRTLRFTQSEIERHGKIGLDVSNVRSVDQFSREVEFWALVMAEVRPDIVQKLERMLRDRLAAEQDESEAAPDVPAAAMITCAQVMGC